MRSATDIDANLIRDINKLWRPVYRGLAQQVAEQCLFPPAEILEVGCFSGGIGLELLKMIPGSRLTVAVDVQELLETFETDWQDMIDETLRGRLTLVHSPMAPLDLPAHKYDLVICRGVFFFLDKSGSVPAEIGRVLSPSGVAFIGGGFGSYTDTEIIREIASESRRLNYELGKRVVSGVEFHESLEEAGLAGRFMIVEEGGLWAVIRGSSEPPTTG